MEGKLMPLYNRTIKNIRFYQENGKEKELLNEIGVLRGIVYCMAAFVGLGGLHIDMSEFASVIEEQNRLLGKNVTE